MSEPPILFFDGVCNLCNGVVDLLLRLDRRQVLRFAPLQGSTAKVRLPPNASLAASVLLLDSAGLHTRSEAVLQALEHVGGLSPLVGLLRLMPQGLRDGLYDAVAARRLRWFGQRAICRVPRPTEIGRFLP